MNFKIKEIYLDNFKSFKDCRIKLDNFNVVVAPNNGGKSNLISALEFIASTFRYGLYRAIDEFGGLETIKNYRSSEEENITIGIKTYSSKFPFKTEKEDFIFRDIEYNIEFSFNKELKELNINAKGKFKIGKSSKKFRKFNFSIRKNKNEVVFGKDFYIPKKYRSLFNVLFINIDNLKDKNIEDLDELFLISIYLFIFLKEIYTYFINSTAIKNFSNYKSGDRLNKEGTNLASILDYLKGKHPEIFENISTSLIGIVDELEGIEIGYDTLGRSKLNFQERLSNKKTKFIPIDIVSDGTINLIATLTALYEPYSKTLIAIEEPERHLHLRAISYLMEEFRNISEEKQILITTQNSETLHNLDFKKDNLIFLFRDYEGNTKAITHRDIPRFKQKLKIYKNDIVELIKLEGLGYLGDYIGEEEEE